MSKPKDKEKEAEAAPAENPDVVIVRAVTAPKISPRGEGGVAYQVGRVAEDVYIRIDKNDGGGRHSREWVPVEGIRAALTPAMRRGEPFKSDGLAGAFVGRSQCNSGFLVASLRAEGILAGDAEKRGMSRLAGDLDAWEKSMQEAAPLLGDDGQPLTAKLRPEPKQTGFPRKADAKPEAPSQDTPPDHDDAKPEDAGDHALKGKMVVRVRRKKASSPSPDAESEEHPAPEAVAAENAEAEGDAVA